MGKRTVRIPHSEIHSQLAMLPGMAVQVVMLSGITHAGKVQTADSQAILLHDGNASWTSRSRHSQRLALSEIQTIIYDVVSPW